MKYSVKFFLLGLALLSSIAKTDVPLPGVEMSAKVRETFLHISHDYQNGNIARIMQARKNKSSEAIRHSVQSDVMHMSVPLLLGTYSNTSAVHSRDLFHDKIFANNPTGTMID